MLLSWSKLLMTLQQILFLIYWMLCLCAHMLLSWTTQCTFYLNVGLLSLCIILESRTHMHGDIVMYLSATVGEQFLYRQFQNFPSLKFVLHCSISIGSMNYKTFKLVKIFICSWLNWMPQSSFITCTEDSGLRRSEVIDLKWLEVIMVTPSQSPSLAVSVNIDRS
jgi:hypothetical protein